MFFFDTCNAVAACDTEIYDFLIISCIYTITKGILASKNMPNRCVYAFSTRAYFDLTFCNNLDSEKVHKDEIFGRQDILQFFSGESKN